MGRSETGTPSRTRTRGAVLLLLLLVLLLQACAGPGDYREDDPRETPPEPEPEKSEGWSKEKKALALNAGIAALVAAYGFQFWDYGGAKWKTSHEGYFGKNTAFGGADKLGHAYAGYIFTLGFAELYERWGYERRKADLFGAISSMGAFTLVEVGDAFSKNGWSTEDLVMDAGGVLFGYVRRRNPELGKLLDFRVEYFPSKTARAGDKSDLITDYSGYKYLLALKLAGIDRLETTPLQWLELHFGYYTRGFLERDKPYYDNKSRHLYFGVGLNMSRILEKVGLKKVGKFFQYYQIPYTYLPVDHNFD